MLFSRSAFNIGRSEPQVGLLFAPGARQDYALNSYVDKAFRGRHVNANGAGLDFFLHAVETDNSNASIEEKLLKLANKLECKTIFVLGEQCKPAILNILSNGLIEREVDFILANDSAYGLTDPIICPIVKSNNQKWSQNLFTLNLFETSLGASFGNALSIFSIEFHKVEGRFPKIAIIGGANVPIIHDWFGGIREYISSSSYLSCMFYSLGTSYAKFNDPWSGYELAKYLDESHGIDLFVSICGASVKGVLAAIRESREIGRRVYFAPFDYDDWAEIDTSWAFIPICLVRNLENFIRIIGASTIETQAIRQLKTGRLYLNDTPSCRFSSSDKTTLETKNTKLECSIKRG